jgi:hypothetical protein
LDALWESTSKAPSPFGPPLPDIDMNLKRIWSIDMLAKILFRVFLAVISCLSQVCKPQQWTNQKSKKQKVIQCIQIAYFHKPKENFDYFFHISRLLLIIQNTFW